MYTTYFQRYVIDGGIIMVFLIPCAFLAVAYSIQNLINLRRGKLIPKALIKKMEKISSDTDTRAFLGETEKNPSTIAAIFNAWFTKKQGLSKKDSDEYLKDIIDEEINKLYHKNNQLSTIYQVSPLLGLLGTVLGMMKSFYEFSIAKEHSIAMLSRGINEALITTLWGLSIAIPAFVVLYYIKQKLFRFETSVFPELIVKMNKKVETFYAPVDAEEIEDNNSIPRTSSAPEDKGKTESAQAGKTDKQQRRK